MKDLFLADEIAIAADSFVSVKAAETVSDPRYGARAKKRKYTQYTVISDNNQLGRLAVSAIAASAKKKQIDYLNAVSVNSSLDGIKNGLEGRYREISNCEGFNADNSACFVTVNSNNISDSEDFLKKASEVFAGLSRGKNNCCVVCVVLPEFDAIPQNIERLAEREYSYYIEHFCENPTPAQQYYRKIEELCRQQIKNGFENIILLRAANVFGPFSDMTPDFDLRGIINEIFDSGTVRIKDGDCSAVYSCSYTTEVLYAMFHALYNCDMGNIYNYCSFFTDIAEIKYSLFKCFNKTLRLECSCGTVEQIQHHCLDTLKMSKTNIRPKMDSPAAIERYASFLRKIPLDNSANIAIYGGKLERIKALEMEMLREIDRICRNNNIEYFLAGGTMLGAIRYGHSIPWDDDFDIGFLRPEFDKFRIACDKELGGKFIHSCRYNETKSHYVVDKVRYADTYFSTCYSAINKIPDGIFIDILVYDNTSDNPAVAKLHYNAVRFWQETLCRIWQGLRRDQLQHKFMKIAYPVMRLFPVDFYHRIFEKTLTLYKKKNECKSVIDGTGKLTAKGTISINGLKKTKRVPFDDGFMAPIPEDPTDYLVFDYGPSYINEPPLSKRVAPHNLSRVDLGGYIFSSENDNGFRKVDLRGELFEAE